MTGYSEGNRRLQRYSRPDLLLHGFHAVSFVLLAITGLLMFLPGIGIFQGSYVLSIVHRVAAVVFVGGPIVYWWYEPGKVAGFFREVLIWDRHDIRWLMAAPGYYFGRGLDTIPTQRYINTGQKIWQLLIIVTTPVFVITGTVLWFFRDAIGVTIYQWLLFAHAMAFVIIVVMFLIHLYLGSIHPGTGESFRSIIDGKVSEAYAKEHHRKWYDETSHSDVQRD